MAITSTSTNALGLTVTRIDGHDALPLSASTSTGVLRKSNVTGCGCAIPGDEKLANTNTNTVLDANRFPTAALSNGVYKS
jgi:hypothetical protein